MIKTIIVATASNNAIGKNNDMLWHLPDDFKFFKRTTLDHMMILGRKTFDSLPSMLPRRTLVIVTRQKDYEAPEGHYVAHSLDEALAICKQANAKETFIAGGGAIYKESLEKGLVSKMLITEVQASFEDAEIYFPEYEKSEWQETQREHHSSDDRHKYAFDFVTYEKK